MTKENQQHGALTVDVRTERGKGPARRLRQVGLIPGVMYGGGQDSLSLGVDPRALREAMDPALLYNTLFSLTLREQGKDGSAVATAMVADYETDALRGQLVHIDFLRVDPNREVVRNVPVEYQGRPAGVLEGGILSTFARTVRVKAKPVNIPSTVTIDVSPLLTNQSLYMRDLGVASGQLLEDPSTLVAHVAPPKAEVEETPEVPEGEEGEAAADGAEGDAAKAAEGDKPAAESGDKAAST